MADAEESVGARTDPDAVAQPGSERAEAQGTLAGVLARGYWDAISGGIQAMAVLLPKVSPVSRKIDEQ